MHSRRDMVLVNRVMGNHRWFLRTLPPLVKPGERALELGAGDGALASGLIARGLAVDAIDLVPAPDSWPAGRQWHRGDLREFSGYADCSVVIGNLIFHHFPDHQLEILGARLRQHARVIVACEPIRRRRSQLFFRFVATLLGANHITLHDAHVSITAGFAQGELSHLLGLDPAAWQLSETQSLFGANRLIAVRRE